MKIRKNKIEKPKKVVDPYYQTGKHRGLRKQVYARDNGLCQECKRKGKIKQLNLHTKRGDNSTMAYADHITPRKQGGTDTLDNYQLLCKPCHDRKTNEEKL